MSGTSTDTSPSTQSLPARLVAQNALVAWANKFFPESTTLTDRPTFSFIDDIRYTAAIPSRSFSQNEVIRAETRSFLQSAHGQYLNQSLENGKSLHAPTVCLPAANGVSTELFDSEASCRIAREVLRHSIFITLEELHDGKYSGAGLGLDAIEAALKWFDGADETVGDGGDAVKELLDQWYGVLSDTQSNDSSAR